MLDEYGKLRQVNARRVLMGKPTVTVGAIVGIVVMIGLVVVVVMPRRCCMGTFLVAVVVMVRQQVVTYRQGVGQPEQQDGEGTDWHLNIKVM
jgi:hypothetical protein